MSVTLEQAVQQARTDTSLRGMTAKTKAHFDAILRHMRQKQRMWGGDLTVLNQETRKLSARRRRTLAVGKVLREMPIAILPHDVLVGACFLGDTVVRCALPSYLLNEELGKTAIQLNHKCPDYDTLLAKGLRGIIDDLQNRVPQAEAAEFEDERREKLEFIDLCIMEAESVIVMAQRFGNIAEERAEVESDPAVRAELLEIARVCRRVPEFPARGLREAAQAVWFYNFALFETQTHISIGRIDQMLNPYFETDWKAGKISLLQAQEIVDSFVLNVNERAQIDPALYVVPDQRSIPGAPEQGRIYYGNGFVTAAENDFADAINHWGQNVLLSGRLPDGGDATGVMTYLFLNAHEKFSMTSPVLTVRMHSGTPPELLERCAEVLKTGGGMPYINNDDIIIPAWRALGVTEEDSYQYANSNCWETLIQGMSMQEMIRQLNFLYFLELALNRGQPMILADLLAKAPRPDRRDEISFSSSRTAEYPVVYGIDTGDAAGFDTFDDLLDAWKRQTDCLLQKTMEHIARDSAQAGSHGVFASFPMTSMLTRGCVERLTDLTRGGAKYTMWHLNAEAVANAADALAAIKKYVYEEKVVTLPRLVEILKSDWAGNEGVALRKRFANDAPKFGNNDDSVDAIAAELVDYFVERGALHARRFPGILFSPSVGTYSWIISIGGKIGASADGRASREPVAANMSPVPGKDVSGPTAAIHSFMKLNLKTMAAGAPIDLRVSGNGLEGEAGTRRIAALIKTFLQSGGNMMTLTITNIEELRKAMENPEQYRGLRVRMGGWSAYFVSLSKASREIHLKRVEHGFA